ncbi:MAG: hypothetical protein IJ525_03080 [Alphaproteobacteria bacterium]|nr:hypothetical protein [Alphaproteobacteria bacterium]
MVEKSEMTEIEKILDRALPCNDNFKGEKQQPLKHSRSIAYISIVGDNNIVIESNWLMLLTILSLIIFNFCK